MLYNRIRIFPYNFRNSYSLDLTEMLIDRGYNCLRVYPDKNYKPKSGDLIINWGSSKYPNWNDGFWSMLNMPEGVRAAIDKLTTFQILRTIPEINIPEWTDQYTQAAIWIGAYGKCVLGRKLKSSFGGKGIKIMHKLEDLEMCPLYTLYKKKKKEYRLHVFNGEVIDITEKRKRNGAPPTDGKIRSWDNGWVFCHENVDIQEEAKRMAIQSVKALGLDFGAVDMIWNQHENKYYVLEVNTAPGIEGTTVTKYADAIEKYFQGVN